MSTGLEAYLVRPDAIRSAIGSADANVVHAVGCVRMSQADHQAVVGLIRGEAPDNALRALRNLCLVLGGRMLPNDQWMPCSTRFFDAVDTSLEAAGAQARVWDLPSGITPTASILGVDLPIETRAAGYSTTDVHAMTARFEGSTHVAPEFQAAVAQAAGWFDAAVEAGTGLLILGV